MDSQKVYTKENPLVVWHFAGDTLRDGSPLPKSGDVLATIRNPKLCERGWHGSVRLIDALKYAPGARLSRRGLYGEVLAQEDKHCASDAVMLADYVDVRAAVVRVMRRVALHALRVSAADALDKAGLAKEAAGLRALPDDCDLRAAADAARAAARAARAARAAADAAADTAADAAAYAADAAADAAADTAADAARAAADAAADAADAAARAARAAAYAAAYAAARAARAAAYAAAYAAADAAADAARTLFNDWLTEEVSK